MSLEHGGRADKEGNTYENRFLARLFLQLINEEFQYILQLTKRKQEDTINAKQVTEIVTIGGFRICGPMIFSPMPKK